MRWFGCRSLWFAVIRNVVEGSLLEGADAVKFQGTVVALFHFGEFVGVSKAPGRYQLVWRQRLDAVLLLRTKQKQCCELRNKLDSAFISKTTATQTLAQRIHWLALNSCFLVIARPESCVLVVFQ